MRLSAVWLIVVGVAAAALAWGFVVGREPVPARPSDLVRPVSSDWYERLPLDAVASTNAYLERIPPDVRVRGEAYADTRLLAFALQVSSVLAATLLFTLGTFAARTRDRLRYATSRPILVDTSTSLVYFTALYALTLPSQIYARFVRPHRAGFSDQTFAGWLTDDLINWAVLTAFYTLGVLIIYAVMRRRPGQWVAWATGAYAVLYALYVLLSPGVIEPLTNAFRPLADGPQKAQIVALARANGVDDVAVVTGDASRQTRLLNAHVSGFGSAARISVDDTTLQETTDPMLRFVVGHELGHFVLDHTIASTVTSTALAALGFIFIALGMRVARRRSVQSHPATSGDIGTLPLFWGLFLVWGFLSLPIGNAFSRVNERQADLYGLNASQAPHGMAEFMIHDADHARLQPTAIDYALFYDHPGDAERVATAMRWREETARLSDRVK